MSAGQSASSAQSSSSTWTEPPWSGWIETTGDALLVLEAARRGLIPRVTRRLVDSERKMITSGSVFVFDEDESGIKRWTDGFYWSPSRILGNFLLYRETDKRGAGHSKSSKADQDVNDGTNTSPDTTRSEGVSLSRPKSDNTGVSVDKQRERTLMGSLTNSYKFKTNGLMKKTFSVTIGGVAQHLISYYKIEDVENGRLRSPSSLPELASLDISPEYLDKTHFRNPPKVEYDIDGIPRYRGEGDDIENSPGLSAPLSGMPLLTDGRVTEGSSGRRGKRFEPYPSPPTAKRARKNTDSSQPDSSSTSTAEPVSPQESTSSATPQPVPTTPSSPIYSDPNVPHNMESHPQALPSPAETNPVSSATASSLAAPAPSPGYPSYMPAYFQVPGYPPPAHTLPGHPPGVTYPPMGVGGSPSLPTQGTAPYPYTGYAPPAAPQVHRIYPSQTDLTGQNQPPAQYYAYYPPHPPTGYPPYQWPVYSSYTQQPQSLQPSTSSQSQASIPTTRVVNSAAENSGQL